MKQSSTWFTIFSFHFLQVCDYYEYVYDTSTWMFILMIPLILLNSIRSLKFLAPFSMLANLFTGAAMCITFYYVFEDLPSVNTKPSMADWKNLPLFFGTAIFALEGIGVVCIPFSLFEIRISVWYVPEFISANINVFYISLFVQLNARKSAALLVVASFCH